MKKQLAEMFAELVIALAIVELFGALFAAISVDLVQLALIPVLLLNCHVTIHSRRDVLVVFKPDTRTKSIVASLLIMLAVWLAVTHHPTASYAVHQLALVIYFLWDWFSNQIKKLRDQLFESSELTDVDLAAFRRQVQSSA
jgi:hypothetical protein